MENNQIIEELKKELSELRQRYNALMAALQIATVATDDINDPLATILGSAEVIKNEKPPLDRKIIDQMDVIIRSVARINSISKQFKILTNLESFDNPDKYFSWLKLKESKTDMEKKVLLVDDNEDFRETLTTMIENLGHSVAIASNGEQGLELFHNSRFDLIITDVHMPKMNGIQLVKEIKRVNPWIPILIITGFDNEEASLIPTHYESVGFIRKPFRQKEIETIIEDIFKPNNIIPQEK